MKKTWKRMLSIALTAAMLCSMAGMDTVSAAQADTTATSSETLPDSVPEDVTPSGEDLTLPTVPIYPKIGARTITSPGPPSGRKCGLRS